MSEPRPGEEQRPKPDQTLTLGPSAPRTLTLGPGAPPGPAVAAGFTWSPGQVIDEIYEIRSTLGEGGFGSVHKVFHRAWRMELAVKSPRGDRVCDRRALELFVQEANTWVGLGLHPHITACYFVRILGLPRIFVEYLEGGSLADWLRLGKVKDLKAVLDMAVQLARAMEYAQSRGLVHRDLKPGNCLMTPGGTLKVTDFGLAKVGEKDDVPAAALEAPKGAKIAKVREATMTGRLGTPEYMAPEQWYQAGKVTQAADVWAFGVILHELAAGEKPFAMSDDEPPDAFYVRMLESDWRYVPPPGMPEGLARLIAACLAPDPAKRPQGFGGLRESLEQAYAKLGEGPYPREAVKDTPLSADVLNNQGVSMADLGRGEEALRLFAAALKIDPTHPGAVYNEGMLLLGSGRLTAAQLLSRLSESAKSRPKDWTPHYLKGLVHLFGKAGSSARLDLDAALAILPDNPLAALARRRAEAGSGEGRLELFVALPEGAEGARMVDSAFQSLLMRARQESAAGDWATAYQTVSKARGVKGHDRSPDALNLVEGLSLRGVRRKLRAGWQKQVFAGSGSASCLCLSPDGRLALSGHADQTLRLWELGTGRLLWTAADAPDVRAVCVMPDGKQAVSVGGDGMLTVWDLDFGMRAKSFPGNGGPVNAVSLTPDGRQALIGCDDKTIRLVDLATGAGVRSLTAHDAPVTASCLSPDGRRAVTGGQDGVLRVWDMVKAELDKALPRHAAAVHALAVSPDGRQALSASEDLTIKLWDLASGQSLRTFAGHQGPVRGVCFTPEGRFALSVGDDRRLKVWDGATGECAWTFEGQAQGLSAVRTTPEGRYAVTAGQDGVRVWELDWDYAFPAPSDWNDGAKPYLESFLSRSGSAGAEEDFQRLLTDLSRRGFGWLKPEGVRSRLESLTPKAEAAPLLPKAKSRLVLALALAAGAALAAIVAGTWWAKKPRGDEGFARRENPAEVIKPAQAPVESAPPRLDYLPKAEKPAQTAQPGETAEIPAGAFMMGSPEQEKEGGDDQHPRHEVYLDAFRMDKDLVTAAQYRKFSQETRRKMQPQPSESTDEHPVVMVTWDDAAGYCRWAGKRLPTEAEFEKAAHGVGDDKRALGDNAWYDANSDGQTHPVGQKKANQYGLYDMTGNVSEWVADWYDGYYYRNSPKRNPQGPPSGIKRVLRGGSCLFSAEWNRAAFRSASDPQKVFPTRGFRCARR